MRSGRRLAPIEVGKSLFGQLVERVDQRLVKGSLSGEDIELGGFVLSFTIVCHRVSIVVGIYDQVVGLFRLRSKEINNDLTVASNSTSSEKIISVTIIMLRRVVNYKGSIVDVEVGIVCDGTNVITFAIRLPLRVLDLIPDSHVGRAIKKWQSFHLIANDCVGGRHGERGFE